MVCPGRDFVMSMFLFSRDLPAVSSIEALTDAKVYVLSFEDARRLITTNDEWALDCHPPS